MKRRTAIKNAGLAALGSLYIPSARSFPGTATHSREDKLLIEDVQIWRLTGTYTAQQSTYQGSVNPIHIYPEYQPQPYQALKNPKTTARKHSANYIVIKTSQDIEGVYGPIDNEAAVVVSRQLAGFLKGKDPLATEKLWDQMYRLNRHGRTGHFMMGISAVDNALWDLKGKYYGVPVYRLLGGPTRENIPVYASTLGNSVQPGDIGEKALWFKQQGFDYQKWFLPYGPGNGAEGLDFNIHMVKNLRKTLGPDYEIMFDAFSGWDLIYAQQWAEAVEQYRPRWIEEAFAVDKMASFAELRQKTWIPVATGEHFYNRWEVKRFLSAEAINVVQADPEWCGGVSELVKICSLCSAFDVQAVPHGHNLHAALHVIASQSPMTCPFGEYLYDKMENYNMFHKYPLKPESGKITLPGVPGFGLDWDEDKIEKKEKVSWS